ncbi:transporter substrate-binding domain-containing protein [Nonomuraea sp. NPDC002799]
MRVLRRALRLTLCGGLVLVAGCGGPAPAPGPTVLEGTIVVGVPHDAPGFALGTINPTGMDINVMKAVEAKLGARLVSTPITSAARAPMLKGKRADLVIHTYSITQSRNDDGIDFAGPYMVSTQALLVRSDDKRFDGKDSLKGKTVCTVGTTTGARVVIPGAIMGTPGAMRQTTKECVEALLEKNTDAIFTDTLLLYGYAGAYAGKFSVILPGVFGENQYYGIGLLGPNKADCLKLNDIIQEYLRVQWRRDFESTLPAAARAFPGNSDAGDYEGQFKPQATDMKLLSCKL